VFCWQADVRKFVSSNLSSGSIVVQQIDQQRGAMLNPPIDKLTEYLVTLFRFLSTESKEDKLERKSQHVLVYLTQTEAP